MYRLESLGYLYSDLMLFGNLGCCLAIKSMSPNNLIEASLWSVGSVHVRSARKLCGNRRRYTRLDGNSLPNAPEHTVHVGLAYTWSIGAIAGSLTARYDYYWQADSYAREFNTVGDEIDSWDQHNASLIYESDDGRWSGRAWIRNIGDDDNITGHYVTSDTSGYYRNYQITEPRIFGASVRFNFGA